MNTTAHRSIFFLIIGLFITTCLVGQTRYNREFRKTYTNPDEIVSLASTTSFDQALIIFNELSKKYLGKIIVDPETRKVPIGIDIDKQHWLTAFETILRHHKLWYEEYADYIKIISAEGEGEGGSQAEQDARKNFNTREVAISAIFFEADGTKLREAGMSWDLFRGKDVNLGISNFSAETHEGLLQLQINPKLDFGSLLAIFKTLEKDQIGEVVSSPQITVRSGDQGRIQVGSDVAVTLRDFAGNSVTQFYSTGSIIKVKPIVTRVDSVDFIQLELQIERSNTATSEVGLEIKKSQAKTTVYLLDGEETIIGGLYVNEEAKSREGVPLLKDLPWWFFGLRYVFGYESKKQIKKELLILIKAELLPTLKERFQSIVNGEQKKISAPELQRKFEAWLRQFKGKKKH